MTSRRAVSQSLVWATRMSVPRAAIHSIPAQQGILKVPPPPPPPPGGLRQALFTAVRLYSSSSSASPSPSPASTPPSSPATPKSSSSDTSPESDAAPTISPYSFRDIQSLVASPLPNRILLDVREPGEIASTGRIPGARNMPINSAPDGLFLPADEFEDRFGFPKPDGEHDEVIMYCKAGVRSRAAARVARMVGYKKVGEYAGSWVDWEGNGGKVER